MTRCPICGFQGMPEPAEGRVTCCSCWFEWGLDDPSAALVPTPCAAPASVTTSAVPGEPHRGRAADDYDFIHKRMQEIAEAEGRKAKAPAPAAPARDDSPYAIDWPMG